MTDRITALDILGVVLMVAGGLLLALFLAGAAFAAVRRLASACRWARRRYLAAHSSAFAEPHRCAVCTDLDADEQNGIVQTDFELWTSEWSES